MALHASGYFNRRISSSWSNLTQILVMAVVCPELVVCSAEQEMPRGAICCLPLARSVPVAVLGTRRHAFSSGSGEAGSRPGRPRMTRRCAISYEPNDVTARYIRFLGEFHSCCVKTLRVHV